VAMIEWLVAGVVVVGLYWWETRVVAPVRRYYTAAPGMAPTVPGHGGSTEVSVLPGSVGEVDLGTDATMPANFLDLYVKGTFASVASDNDAVMPGRQGYLAEPDARGGQLLRMRQPMQAGVAKLTVSWSDNQGRPQTSTITVRGSG